METDKPQREKAVPRMLQDLVNQAARLVKLSEDLESKLDNGLRPISAIARDACEAKQPGEPEGRCCYEKQLSDIAGQLTVSEKRLDDILGRLEV